MNTLYKYTSNFGVNFFKNPKVKLSNPSYLNDPFESEAGDNVISVIEKSYMKSTNELLDGDTKDVLNYRMKEFGVFSLSETPRNPLMWAHYANEHNGICIGYNRYLFKDIRKYEDDIITIAEYEPVKVNYDNYRFDRQQEILCSDDLANAIKSTMITKSDEWIYEKEHRCIIPLICATSFFVDKKSAKNISHFNKETTINAYLKLCIDEGVVKRINKSEYKISEHECNEKRSQIVLALSTFGCVSFLYEIDHKFISSIYLGFRASDKYVNDIYSMINEKGSKLSHVKLYKFKLSSKRFELLPEVVNSEYIKNMIAD
ncbi:DUF2971 domain-containing protein [Aeromonas salmonicida]|uniref:DUF2971 domain-containing protein n=1 Tax=Aeromonas salmonicida TaxID=645 RepID=UPI00259EAF4D|nr:DUF2971 domain-containing protein [Aeromonas salmonicida]MDM5127364.1 DUF2971 domain-containing protein [Aeromonas salmonicida]